MRVAVVGGGSWGTAFARLLADREHEVTLACRDPGQAQADFGDDPIGIQASIDRSMAEDREDMDEDE